MTAMRIFYAFFWRCFLQFVQYLWKWMD